MMRQRVEPTPGRFRWGLPLTIVSLLALMLVGYVVAPRRESSPAPAADPQEPTMAPPLPPKSPHLSYTIEPPSRALATSTMVVEAPPMPASTPSAPVPPVPPTPPVPTARSIPATPVVPRPSKADLDQQRKAREAELKSLKLRVIGRKSERTAEDESPLRPPRTPFTLSAGALLPLIQEDQMTSAAPGVASFTVRNAVSDSITGDYELVPQGSRVLVRTTGGQQAGTERFPVTSLVLTYPNGYELELGSAHVGDASGQAGLSDQVDHKTGAIIATILVQMFSRAGTMALTGGYGGDTQDAAATTAAREGLQGGAQHVTSFLHTSPTFTIRDAYLASLRLEKRISLPAAYPFIAVRPAPPAALGIQFRPPGR